MLTTHGTFWKSAWPMTLSGASIPLLSLSDTIIAGHALPEGGLAALIVGTKIYEFAGLVFFFLSVSTSMLVSSSLGKQDPGSARLWLMRSLLVAAVLSLAIVPVLFIFAPRWADFLGAQAPIIDSTLAYVNVRLIGLPALILMESMLGFLLGALASRSVMMISIVMNMLNILLNLFFVFFLDFGISGLAWGTVIAQWGALSFACVLLARQDTHLLPSHWRFGWPDLASWGALRRLFSANINLLIRSILVLAYLQGITFMGGQLGVTLLSAMGIVLTYIMAATFLQGGIARTTEVFIARLETAPSAVVLGALKVCGTWYLSVGAFLSLIYFFCADLLISLITQDATIEHASQAIWPYLVVYVACIPWVFFANSLLLGIQKYRFLRNTYLISFSGYVLAIYGVFLEEPTLARLWLCVLVFDAIRGGLMVCGTMRYLVAPHLKRYHQTDKHMGLSSL